MLRCSKTSTAGKKRTVFVFPFFDVCFFVFFFFFLFRYWGHEHRCLVYDTELHGLRKGRCIGHAAMPEIMVRREEKKGRGREKGSQEEEGEGKGKR